MRLCFMFALTINMLSQGLTVVEAAPQHASMRIKASYVSCNCHYGYERNGAGICTPEISCYIEGGRCSASCGLLQDRSPPE
jgi:hypothetical protein